MPWVLSNVVAGERLKGIDMHDWQLINARPPYMYENSKALPRAFLVPSIQCASSFEDHLPSPHRLPSMSAIGVVAQCAGRKGTWVGGAQDPGNGRGSDGAVTVADDNLDTLTLQVKSSDPPCWCLSEQYDPGWTISRDSQKATGVSLRRDLAVRADTGRKQHIARALPGAGLGPGTPISVGSLLLLVVLVGAGALKPVQALRSRR